MKLWHKVALLLLAAGTLPLGTAGFWSIARSERALEAAIKEALDQTARHGAVVVANEIEGGARRLAQTAELIAWDRLSPAELGGALEMLERQAHAREVALLRDGDPRLDAAPYARARAEGQGAVVYSAPFMDGGQARVTAATAVAGGVLGLQIRLDPVERRLEEVRDGRPLLVLLVDANGRPVARSGPDLDADASLLADALAGKDGHARRCSGGALVAGFAPVGGLDWSVIVEESSADAFAAARALRRRTLLGAAVAALAAVLMAFVFARRLTSALERLTEAARAVGQGQLDARVELASDDEVATLARAFNRMGQELSQSRAEIERWNKELEARVVERTQALKDAQAQLVQAQKLAALGQLGAGVAHEINNPLAGVLGHVQLLLAERAPEAPDYTALKHIEEGAQRAAEIVQNLHRFSVQRKEPVKTGVDLNKLVKETLSLTESVMRAQKIELAFDLSTDRPRAHADAGQVAQVLFNLVSNARTAMPNGGTLRISTRKEQDEATLVVEDSGKGIAPEIKERIFEPFFTTKDEWSNVGLGLSVSWRIVAEHGGRIDVASALGRGATFTVRLPST